ncbi:MAG: transposase [Cellulosilyticum sp.]|nr:transposase [Cellulosilyticum sp.]
MAKLTTEDKRKIIRLHEERQLSISEIARSFYVNKHTIKILIRTYQVHGESCLIKQQAEKS